MESFREVVREAVMYACVMVVIIILSIKIYKLEKELEKIKNKVFEIPIAYTDDREIIVNAISEYFNNFRKVLSYERVVKRPIDLNEKYGISLLMASDKTDAKAKILELVNQDKNKVV